MRTNLTPMEKMDVVYEIIVDEKDRRKREFWYRIIKWIIILMIWYGVLTHPEYVVGKIIGYVQPIIMEQMKTIIADQKDSLLKQAKDILPDSN